VYFETAVELSRQAAHFDSALGEFIVMYDDIRAPASPSEALLAFCQSTCQAGARAAKWDRDSLERSDPTRTEPI